MTKLLVAQRSSCLGRTGYIVKARAGRELLAAVEALRKGKLFVGTGLNGHGPAEIADKQTPNGLYPDQALAPTEGRLIPFSRVLTQRHGRTRLPS